MSKTQAPTPGPKKSRPRKRRPRPLQNPPVWSARLYVRIAPADIARFRFLLEAHDNLALFTVVDRVRGVLLLRYSPSQSKEFFRFLEDVKTVFPVEQMLQPVD